MTNRKKPKCQNLLFTSKQHPVLHVQYELGKTYQLVGFFTHLNLFGMHASPGTEFFVSVIFHLLNSNYILTLKVTSAMRLFFVIN